MISTAPRNGLPTTSTPATAHPTPTMPASRWQATHSTIPPCMAALSPATARTYTSASLDGYLRLDSAGAWHMPVIDLILGKQHESTRGNTDPSTRFKPFTAPSRRPSPAICRPTDASSSQAPTSPPTCSPTPSPTIPPQWPTAGLPAMCSASTFLESFVGVTGQVDLSPGGPTTTGRRRPHIPHCPIHACIMSNRPTPSRQLAKGRLP